MAIVQWAEIVQAAGFNIKPMSAEDVYQLAGRIMKDPAVHVLRLAAREGVFIGDTVPALKQMTQDDLQQLRMRVKWS